MRRTRNYILSWYQIGFEFFTLPQPSQYLLFLSHLFFRQHGRKIIFFFFSCILLLRSRTSRPMFPSLWRWKCPICKLGRVIQGPLSFAQSSSSYYPTKNYGGKDKELATLTDDEQELWDTLDAAVVQWIYSTISTDLLNTIIEADFSVMTLWTRLRDLFQHNENSRAVALEHEFNNTYLKDFSSVSAYCQHLKTLADQLKNVVAPVSNNRLVLRMVGGLTSAYKGVASIIRHKKVLPPFYEVHSMLALEEASMREAAVGGDDAMVVTDHVADMTYVNRPQTQGRGESHNKGRNNKNWNSKNNGDGGGPTTSGGSPGSAGCGSNRGGGQAPGGGKQMSYPTLSLDVDAVPMGLSSLSLPHSILG